MARIVNTSSEETISRKIAIKGNEVHLINHSVKQDKDSTDQMVFERIILLYPDCEASPAWLLEKAAKSDWITVQRKMRTLSQAKREAFEGKTLDVTKLDEILDLKQKREPFKDRLAKLARGELTRADFEAGLTKAEQELWTAMQALKAEDIN